MAGHDEQWAEEVDEDYRCPICLLVARDAVAHSCGKLFCAHCWAQCAVQKELCPLCQEGGEAAPAHRDRKAILNVNIRCPLECDQAFRLGNKEAHVASACVRRSIPCTLCGGDTTPATLQQHRDTECSHRTVRCPDCGLSVQYREMSDHRRVACTHRSVPCPLCHEAVHSKDLLQHMEQSAGTHIMALLTENDRLKSRIRRLERAMGLDAVEEVAVDAAKDAERAAGGMREGQCERWHPGRIGAAPNGIGRLDGGQVLWANALATNGGYTWDDYHEGWKEPLSRVFSPKDDCDCQWTCCGGLYDAAPCATRPVQEEGLLAQDAPEEVERDVANGQTQEGQCARWHPGRIGAAPNGINRSDNEDIIWGSAVDHYCGYTWDNYSLGWEEPLSTVFEPDDENSCQWTCCGGLYDAPPCATRPAQEEAA